MLKILGFLDLITAVIVVFVQLGFLGPAVLKFFAVYLLIKGLLFIKSLSSVLDIACAAYLLLMIFGLKFILAYFVAVYLFQKAVVSFA